MRKMCSITRLAYFALCWAFVVSIGLQGCQLALSKIPDTSVVGKNINVTIINKMDKLIGRGGDLGAGAET